ncbi:acyltransferase [Pandoraea sputorum]|uniref:acyltransferase n=1 Tax=Pandoraea sputorum TaxID=93222 RepID=UPI00124095D6|nr:acyltransferase [Pandoraea sputorum]VVE84408.1 Putative acetyltransferase [Pandoraea sputorum]
MLRQLYLSPVGYIISLVMNVIGIFTRPFMVYGYYCRPDKRFLRYTRISSSVKVLDANQFRVGDHCWIGHYSIIDASGGVTLGEGVQFGFLSAIFSHSSHASIRLLGKRYIDVPTEQRLGLERAPVKVGDYCFIGTGSILLPGAVLGKGCVVAVGSVVRGEFPDHSVIAGNPARRVGDTRKHDTPYINEPGIDETYFDPERLAELRRLQQQDNIESQTS